MLPETRLEGGKPENMIPVSFNDKLNTAAAEVAHSVKQDDIVW